jgi:alpha-N-arabinofuranosidase
VSLSGLWDSAADRIHAASEANVKKVRPSVLRFPGGSLSDIYIWEDGLSQQTLQPVGVNDRTVSLAGAPQWRSGSTARFLGPSGGRYGAPFRFLKVQDNLVCGVEGIGQTHPPNTPVRLDHRVGQPEWFQNGFGSLELIKLSDALGSELLLTVNFSTGVDLSGNVSVNASLDQRVMRAVAWLAFMNGSVSDVRPIGIDPEGNDWRTVGHWARKRVEGGRDEPLAVSYWEVGNELFWKSETGQSTVEEYARGFIRFARAMKAIDPTIKVGAAGMSDPWGRGDLDQQAVWNAALLRAAGDDMDFLAVHPYYPSALRSQVSFESETWFEAVMAGASQAVAHLEKIRQLIEQTLPAGKKLDIIVSEYGIWPADSKDSRDFSNLARALYDSDLLLHLLRAGERLGVLMATGWNLQSNTETALIKHDWATGLGTTRPQYHAFSMLRDLDGARLLPVTVDSPAFDSPKVGNMEAMKNLPVLDAAAFIDKEELVKLLVVNRDLQRVVRAVVHLDACQPREAASALVLSGAAPSSHNEDHPVSVQPASQPVDASSQPIAHAFPPHSISLLELGRRGGGGTEQSLMPPRAIRNVEESR